MDGMSREENTMEELNNVVVDEVIEEVVAEPTKPSVGNALVKVALIVGTGLGLYGLGKWVKGKVKAHKAKKAAEEFVEDDED